MDCRRDGCLSVVCPAIPTATYQCQGLRVKVCAAFAHIKS